MSLDVYLEVMKPTEVFSANITHNLNKMAEAAGVVSLNPPTAEPVREMMPIPVPFPVT